MKIKTIATIGVITIAAAAFGTGLYFTAQNFKEVATTLPVEESVDSVADPTANIVLNDEATQIQKIQEEISDPKPQPEKANGTGEDAAVETADDLAYLQQLAEENGTEMPNVTITMYANTNCSIRLEASEDSAKIGSLKKGDSIQVSKVGEWNTVVLDDGKEGFVRSDLLNDAQTTETADSSVENNDSETVDNSANAENNTSTEVSQPQTPPATDNVAQAEPEEPKKSSGSGSTITDPEIAAITQRLLEEGVIGTEQMTGTENMHELYVDPNAAENAGIDLTNVTLH